jgi:hypothetical protein
MEIFEEERARQLMKDARRGDTVKALLPPQTDTKLLEKLKTGSAMVGDKVSP